MQRLKRRVEPTELCSRKRGENVTAPVWRRSEHADKKGIPRKKLGNRKDLLRVYRASKELIHRFELTHFKQLLVTDTMVQMTICNLWRVERDRDGALRFLEFSLATERWELSTADRFPYIPFWPVISNGRATYWCSVVAAAIAMAVEASGGSTLPRYEGRAMQRKVVEAQNELQRAGFTDVSPSGDGENSVTKERYSASEYQFLLNELLRKMGVKLQLAPESVFVLLRRRYVGDMEAKGGGTLKEASLQSAERGVRAALWEHFIDREVLSALLVINWSELSLCKYFTLAQNYRDGLLRVAREHRNLLPLLVDVKPQHWNRPDLFSRSQWVRGHRARLPVGKRNFYARGKGVFETLPSKAAWRWMLKASPMVISAWRGRHRDPLLIQALTEASTGIEQRLPVCAIIGLIRLTPARGYLPLPRDPLNNGALAAEVVRFFRAYLRHAASLWATQGFAALKRWIASGVSMQVVDFLNHDGFARSLPDKNSTWMSLCTASDEWHARAHIERLVSVRNLTWSSALPTTEINGYECIPLTSTKALATEGYALHHCVQNYDRLCGSGQYQVFAVHHPDGGRSTLGFYVGTSDRLRVHQHYGPCNETLDPSIGAIGKRLVETYYHATK